MTSPSVTSILQDLAAGRIDTAEAAKRIRSASSDDSAKSEPQTPVTNSQTETDEPPPGAADFTAEQAETGKGGAKTGNLKAERVAIRAIGRRVRVVTEPAVATVAVDGQHVLRRNGEVMEVTSDGEFSASIDGFQLLRTRKLDDLKSLSIGKELFVRVNPRMIVDAEVTGGSLTLENILKVGRVRITAGSASLSGVGQLSEAIVQAGQLTLSGAIVTGRSRVRAESGSLTIKLDDDSDVTIRTESQLGRISWQGGHTGAGDEVIMGEGRAKMDVSVVMGLATIVAGSKPEGE